MNYDWNISTSRSTVVSTNRVDLDFPFPPSFYTLVIAFYPILTGRDRNVHMLTHISSDKHNSLQLCPHFTTFLNHI